MKQLFAKIMILVTVILMDILGGAELDLFVPSFPELKTYFGLSAFWLEALLSVNFIGFVLSLFFVGSLADRYGRKPIILLGLLVFTLGSVLCLWAPSYRFLLTGRFLQGVGVAAPATLCFLIIADSYPLRQQQYLMAMLNGLVNASIAAAPVIGSYITTYFHWRGNFVALLVLGLGVLMMTVFFIPAHKPPKHKETISLRGYIPIFKSKPLTLLIVSLIFMFVPYCVFVGMSPLLYMEGFGVSLKHFGYYQGALALVFAAGSVLSGLVISRYYNQKKMLMFSGQILIVCMLMIGYITLVDSRSPILITTALVLHSVGVIMPSTLLYPLCLNFMPRAKGRVAAVLQGARLALSALALEVAGYYYVGSFRSIGFILIALIFIGVITLCFVLRNRELMKFVKA